MFDTKHIAYVEYRQNLEKFKDLWQMIVLLHELLYLWIQILS
jgi:hypothetical protein